MRSGGVPAYRSKRVFSLALLSLAALRFLVTRLLESELPAMTGQGYEEMPIASGDDASLAFLTITFEDVATEGVARTRKELLAYCALDTEGMVRIIERLQELAG